MSSFETRFKRAMAATTKKRSKQDRIMDELRAGEAQIKEQRLAAAAAGGPPACPECGQNVPVVQGRFVEHSVYRHVTPREGRTVQCNGGGRRPGPAIVEHGNMLGRSEFSIGGGSLRYPTHAQAEAALKIMKEDWGS